MGDFSHMDFNDMKDMFIGIQRRAGGGLMLESNDEHREKIRAEFMRMRWPKKPPELSV